MKKYDSYVICTSPRSGSTLLCDLLASTGRAGNPNSYFHRPSISDWLNSFELTVEDSAPERAVLAAIFKAAIAKGSLDTGVFGLRLQQHSFEFFIHKLSILYSAEPNDAQRFQKAFGRTAFLYLVRQDKLKQAISCVKAEQTGLWHMASDGTQLERLSPPQTPTYDANRIKACITEMEASERRWKKWFKQEEIHPLQITYKALSNNPIKTLLEVLIFLGIEYDPDHCVKPGVAKMADSVSQDWVNRYRDEKNLI